MAYWLLLGSRLADDLTKVTSGLLWSGSLWCARPELRHCCVIGDVTAHVMRSKIPPRLEWRRRVASCRTTSALTAHSAPVCRGRISLMKRKHGRRVIADVIRRTSVIC